MSKLIVEIHNVDVDYRSGTSAKTGKDWEMHEQEAWVRFPGSPYPTRIIIGLQKLEGQNSVQPLKAGIYSLDPSALMKVGNFGSLEIDDRKIQTALKFEKAHAPAQQPA